MMGSPLYYQISALTGYGLFLFKDLSTRDTKKLIKFCKHEEHNFVACLAELGGNVGCMVCRLLEYSTRDSYEKKQKEILDMIKEDTGLYGTVPYKNFVSITYETWSALYQNDSPEAYSPF